MVNEKSVRNSFKAVKRDMEAMKDEVAFLVRRISNLENTLVKKQIEESAKPIKTKETPKRKVKKTSKKKHKEITWNDHVAAVRRRFPRLTLKEALEVASKTWKKKKNSKTKK